MGLMDIAQASSMAAERSASVAREAEHRRVARERSTVTSTAPTAGARTAGIVGRAVAWLHLVPHHGAAR